MNDSKYATSSTEPVKNGTRWCTFSGLIFNTLPVPSDPAPPACSAKKLIGAHSYNKRNLPVGFLASPG